MAPRKTEKLAYVKILTDIITRFYEKEMVFYNEGEWYSREHSRNITIAELEEWIIRITASDEDDNANDDDYHDINEDTLQCGCCACCGCTCQQD